MHAYITTYNAIKTDLKTIVAVHKIAQKLGFLLLLQGCMKTKKKMHQVLPLLRLISHLMMRYGRSPTTAGRNG